MIKKKNELKNQQLCRKHKRDNKIIKAKWDSVKDCTADSWSASLGSIPNFAKGSKDLVK